MDEDIKALLSDVQRNLSRATKAKYLETKPEVAENIYPLLQALVEVFNEHLENVEGTLAELISQQSTLIQADVSALILNALGLGREVCSAIEAGADCKDLIGRFRVAADEAQVAVVECSVEAEAEESVEPEPEPVVNGKACEPRGEEEKAKEAPAQPEPQP